MSYLLDINHRRIRMLYGVAVPELAMDRLQPYRDCLISAGLPVEEELIVPCGAHYRGWLSGSPKVIALSPRPSAIIVINDLLAIGSIACH